MTEYYSHKAHFERPIPVAVFNQEMQEFLEAIESATKVVQDEGVGHLYFTVGEATLGAEKPYESFQKASDRSVDMQTYAQKIHSDIMETIDSKFTKGMDDTFETLNAVNGQNKQYTAQNMSYKEQRTFTDNNGNILSYKVDKKYNLSQLLDEKTSPIKATKDVYAKHLSIVKEKIQNKDSLTDKELKMIEGKTEEELVQLYFPTEIGDYQRLKATTWQEENKAWLVPVERVFYWATAAFSLASIVFTGGTTIPAAGAISSALLIGETGYSAVSGNSFISGTQLSTEDRAWAIAETGAVVISMGASKWLSPLAEARKSTKLGKVASVIGRSDDSVDSLQVVYDVLTKSEEEGGQSVAKFGLFKASGLISGQLRKGQVSDLSDQKVGDVDIRYQEYASSKLAIGQKPLSMVEWDKKVRTFERNKKVGADFKATQTEKFKEVAQHVENNITIATTIDGQVQKVRVSAIGVGAEGRIHIQDYTTKDHISVSRQAILDNISKNGGVIVGKGKGEFVGGIEVPKGTRVDVIKGGSQFSPEWQVYLNEFPKAGLTQSEINDIVKVKPDIEKGIVRPNPQDYLPTEYLEQHKKLFDEGVAAFVKDDFFIQKFGNFGREDGAFVFPREVAESMIKEADGDPRKLEALLGLDAGSLGDSPKMVLPQEFHNYRIPDGNEGGSRDNPQWRPGGKTYPGGVPEAVIDPVPKDKVTLVDIW